MAQTIEEKLVFGLSPRSDGGADLLLGLPAGAWDYCKDGKTHTLDLSSLGIPIRLMVYGGPSHDACKAIIDEHNRRLGIASSDERRKDYSIR